MPTSQLTPVAESTYTQWTLGAGGSKVAAVDPPEDDASYIQRVAGAGTYQQGFTLDDLDSQAENINTHSTVHRAWWWGAGGPEDTYGGMRIDAADNYGAKRTVGGPVAGTTYTDVDLGGIPSVSSMNSAVILIKGVINSGTAGLRCSMMYNNCTFEYSSGGTTWMITKWLFPVLPLVGHSLLRREIVKLSNLVRPKHWLSTENDFDAAKRFFERRPVWQLCRPATVEPPLCLGLEPLVSEPSA
jgi:hypothetical protein